MWVDEILAFLGIELGHLDDASDPDGSVHAKLNNITDYLDGYIDEAISSRLPDVMTFSQASYTNAVGGNNTVTVFSLSGKGFAALSASAYFTNYESPNIPYSGSIKVTIDGGSETVLSFFSSGSWIVAFNTSLVFKIVSSSGTGTYGSAIVHLD